MTPVLQVRDLRVVFGGVVAVDGVEFGVTQGQLLGLIGPNGAGKTTVMRSITGIVRPASGVIELEGRRLSGVSVHERTRRGLALSQQLVRPFRDMTVIENVAFAAGYRKTGNPLRAFVTFAQADEHARAMELLEMVGIAQYSTADTGELPLGVLKRLEVARALALDPKLLLLDEPLAGLNSGEAATLADTIRSLNDGGLTIVLIEHNLGEVMRICPDLVVLDNGKKIGDGPAHEVMADPAVRAAYLGEVAGDPHVAA